MPADTALQTPSTEIRKRLSQTAVSWIQTVLTSALVAAPSLIGPWLDTNIPPEWRPRCIRWLLSTNVLALSLLLYLWRKNRLQCRFGLLWDRHLHPHCPRCRLPLVNIFPRTVPDTLARRETGLCPGCDRLLAPCLEHLPPGIVRDFANARLILQELHPETIDERNVKHGR